MLEKTSGKSGKKSLDAFSTQIIFKRSCQKKGMWQIRRNLYQLRKVWERQRGRADGSTFTCTFTACQQHVARYVLGTDTKIQTILWGRRDGKCGRKRCQHNFPLLLLHSPFLSHLPVSISLSLCFFVTLQFIEMCDQNTITHVFMHCLHCLVCVASVSWDFKGQPQEREIETERERERGQPRYSSCLGWARPELSYVMFFLDVFAWHWNYV